ncbi:MAG: PH domain-containing protein [bacterium]|nr:PH domain-containing protein [bacterium]
MDTGENAIYKHHPHPLLYLQNYFIGAIFIVAGVVYTPIWPAIIIGILVIVVGELLRKAVTYYVLDSGVARGYHFFSTSRKFAEYGSIQNVEVNQSFLENILGIGSVKFDTSGSDIIEVNFHGVRNPYKIEKIVREKMSLK